MNKNTKETLVLGENRFMIIQRPDYEVVVMPNA